MYLCEKWTCVAPPYWDRYYSGASDITTAIHMKSLWWKRKKKKCNKFDLQSYCDIDVITSNASLSSNQAARRHTSHATVHVWRHVLPNRPPIPTKPKTLSRQKHVSLTESLTKLRCKRLSNNQRTKDDTCNRNVTLKGSHVSSLVRWLLLRRLHVNLVNDSVKLTCFFVTQLLFDFQGDVTSHN